MPGLSEIRCENELYKYLKDGTELCRMIGLLVKGRVLERIIYNPNNISILEEKNIGLFVNFVKEEVGLGNMFGDLGIRVFKSFSNFNIALSGLADLSEKIQKKFKIPRFKSSGSRIIFGTFPFTNYAEDSSNAIQGYQEASLDPVIEVVKDQETHRSVDQAINEMIGFNKQFLKKVLRPLKLFAETNTDPHLKVEFFQAFQLEKVTKLHEQLKANFDQENVHKNIGDYFANLKDEFLVYAEIFAGLKVVLVKFADAMSVDGEFKRSVKVLEEKVNESLEEPKEFQGIMDLSKSIRPNAVKFPLLLKQIEKTASKESNAEVQRSARRAFEIVSDVVF